MATPFDLVQEDYAEIKLTATDTFKVQMLKRKDKSRIVELQNSTEQIDIIDVMLPYVLDGKGDHFIEVANELTFPQLQALQGVFLEMNGMKQAA